MSSKIKYSTYLSRSKRNRTNGPTVQVGEYGGASVAQFITDEQGKETTTYVSRSAVADFGRFTIRIHVSPTLASNVHHDYIVLVTPEGTLSVIRGTNSNNLPDYVANPVPTVLNNAPQLVTNNDVEEINVD